MGFTVTEPYQRKTHPTAKNRVGGFFGEASNLRLPNRPQPPELHRENPPTPTKTASGVHYYGYRYYDPLTGRWPSRDPIQERGGINIYAIVNNDTISKIDLLGRATIAVQGNIISTNQIGSYEINDYPRTWSTYYSNDGDILRADLLTFAGCSFVGTAATGTDLDGTCVGSLDFYVEVYLSSDRGDSQGTDDLYTAGDPNTIELYHDGVSVPFPEDGVKTELDLGILGTKKRWENRQLIHVGDVQCCGGKLEGSVLVLAKDTSQLSSRFGTTSDPAEIARSRFKTVKWVTIDYSLEIEDCGYLKSISIKANFLNAVNGPTWKTISENKTR